MRIKSVSTALSAILLMMASCTNERDPQPDLSSDSETLKISLNLSVPSSSFSSRASGHYQVVGEKEENYIFLGDNEEEGDFRILIFDKDGNFNQEIEASDCKIEQRSETSYNLIVDLAIKDDDTKSKLAKFKVIVLANWKSAQRKLDSNYDYPYFSGKEYTIGTGSNSLYENAGQFYFTIADQTMQEPWWPNSDEKYYIPMFGVSEEVDLEYALMMGKYGDDPFTTIKMLRSLAKIEIVDKTTSGMTWVGISHLVDKGRFIPDVNANPDWDKEDTQIVSPSLPDNFFPKLDPGASASFYHFKENGLNSDRNKVWIYYIPELDLTKYDGNGSRAGGPEDPDPGDEGDNPVVPSPDDLKGGRPQIGVMLNGSLKSFDIDNNIGTSGKGDKSLSYLLRNHIYRYTVEESSSQLLVNLEVLPWDMQWNDEPWNFENIKIDKYLTWTVTQENDEGETVGNGYRDDKESLQLFMKPGVDDYAEATFRLSAPVGAKWYAVLIDLNQDHHNAFEFVEGYDSGIIDGKNDQVIRIKNVNEKVYEKNEARLEIMVEYPDKTTKQVFVVSGGNNYTIVQEVTEFFG